jgi:hypothetical protein
MLIDQQVLKDTVGLHLPLLLVGYQFCVITGERRTPETSFIPTMLFYNATYPYRHQTSNYGRSLELIDDLPKETIS